jgi:hypothetical protein
MPVLHFETIEFCTYLLFYNFHMDFIEIFLY